jgi:ACS family sodium-dependent inorganic phosphate cotransporter
MTLTKDTLAVLRRSYLRKPIVKEAAKSERSRAVAFMVSGIPLDTLFALTTTGFIIEKWGWESVFYLFGGLGLVFALVWFNRIHNGPKSHPQISDNELNLLSESQDIIASHSQNIKWYQLLKHKPAIALITNHFCSNWGFYVLLSWLPSYFKTVQGVNLTSAGFYAAAPWLTMFLVSNISAWVADKLIANGTEITFVRKSFQIIGLLGSALFFF